MSSASMDNCMDSCMDNSMDSCMNTPSELEESDSRIISPEDNTNQDSKENIDLFAYSIWQCMKRINSNLNFLSQKLNNVESEKVPSSTLDDDHFLLMFPLKEIEDVIELESRLADDSSDFIKKFIAYITPIDTGGQASDLKHFVRSILRTLFTYGLAGNYSWRGFRGNFQIGNLKTVQLIFEISKNKFKNVSKPSVNVFIKEWIRYAKQRRNQLKKVNNI